MIIGSLRKVWKQLGYQVIKEGEAIISKYGSSIQSKPKLIIIKNPEYIDGFDFSFWYMSGESYLDRIEGLLNAVAIKLKVSPFTRRMSIPIWLPKDHLSSTPPAVTEVSFLYFNDKINITAYIRSLNIYEYFPHNFDLLNYLLEKVCKKTGFEKGSIGILIGCPHIYSRDVDRFKEDIGIQKSSDVYGYTKDGTHIVEESIASAWHSALEIVYKGQKKRTEWGDTFSRQNECKFIPRLFIEIKNPKENQIHDKAPFSRDYGINYAHNYVIHAESIDKSVKSPIKKSENETYTYAERARFCEADDIKLDQLYKCIVKLRKNKASRDCYVGISRPWDIFCNEPPCLRGYQFLQEKNVLSGVFYMRSNDVFGAMHANMFAFALLTSYISELTGFKKYKYYHFANDAHIYGDSLKTVKDILYPETPAYLEDLIKRKSIKNENNVSKY